MSSRARQRGKQRNASPRRGGVRQAGFSLIELLIVIAIILVIAAIAIPNLLRSRMAANEAAAVSNMRGITTANVVYFSTYNIGFPPALINLGDAGGLPSAAAAGLIDSVLASGTKSGFTFVYAATDTNGDGQMDTFTLNANPSSPGVTGARFFFTDPTGVIRGRQNAVASASDPPI